MASLTDRIGVALLLPALGLVGTVIYTDIQAERQSEARPREVFATHVLPAETVEERSCSPRPIGGPDCRDVERDYPVQYYVLLERDEPGFFYINEVTAEIYASTEVGGMLSLDETISGAGGSLARTLDAPERGR